MKYITGMQALNLTCNLETSGDWHQPTFDWSKLEIKNSEDSFFGNYGIYQNSHIPEHNETFFVANHIRAILDLIYDKKFALAQGMRKDFICNENYTSEIFNKIYEMRNLKWWKDISSFMEKEYKLDWLHFIMKRDGTNEKMDV